MTTTTASIPTVIPTLLGLRQRLRDFWTEARAAHQRRRQAARMRESLTGLSDAGLRDLGFHRCEIDSLVAETQMSADQRRRRVGAL